MARGMRALSVVGAALLGVQGARIKRANGPAAATKFIDGVPVINYHVAYGAKTSLLERQNYQGSQEWMVVLNADVSDEQVHALCQMSKCVREGHPSKGGVPYFEVAGTEEDLARIVAAGGMYMKFIEPDASLSLVPTFEATPSAASWGLDRVGVAERGSGEGYGTHVYVLDTGIRHTHADYQGRAIPTLDLSLEGGGAVECDSNNMGCARDAQGHGSHCAGTAAGASYGVAPAATIHSVKVLGDNGSGQFSWSVDALDWLATKGEFPSVASMSLGGNGVVPSMETAIDIATQNGVVVVVAGGNSNSDACGFSPAYVPSAITVGSTTSNDERSSFSNYGACTDIWAPGSAITSCAISSDTAQRTISGTSMACPHVSGAAALILASSPNLKASGVMAALEAKAEKGAISDLKSGDTNSLLWVGAGAAPVPAPTPAPTEPPNFVCNDGCDIRDTYLNDGFCDCTGCEDEDSYTCGSCAEGCPSRCGAWTNC